MGDSVSQMVHAIFTACTVGEQLRVSEENRNVKVLKDKCKVTSSTPVFLIHSFIYGGLTDKTAKQTAAHSDTKGGKIVPDHCEA